MDNIGGSELIKIRADVSIDTLFGIYKEDRYEGRVYYMSSGVSDFDEYRLWIYDLNLDEFDIVLFRVRFGVSKTNRIYSNKKVIFRIRYRKSGLWLCQGRRIIALKKGYMLNVNNEIVNAVSNILRERLPWLKFIEEEFLNYNKSYNYVINRGVFSKRGIMKAYYGFEYPLSKILFELDKGFQFNKPNIGFSNLQYYKDWLVDENKLKPKIISDNFNLFLDTLKMAKTLDLTVNLGWSLKRLTAEHDRYSKLLTDIIYKHDTSDLNVSDIYIKYSERYDRRLITSVITLVLEGRKLNHCVASRKSNINSGYCAIYSLEGYTLELRGNMDGLYISEIQGYSNKVKIPLSLTKEIESELEEFNIEHFPNRSKRRSEFKQLSFEEFLLPIDCEAHGDLPYF